MEYLSAREAADVLQVEPRSVTRYCATGRLEAARMLGRWLIPDTALLVFQSPPSGRPRVPDLGHAFDDALRDLG